MNFNTEDLENNNDPELLINKKSNIKEPINTGNNVIIEGFRKFMKSFSGKDKIPKDDKNYDYKLKVAYQATCNLCENKATNSSFCDLKKEIIFDEKVYAFGCKGYKER